MRHKKKGRKLGRTASHRKATLKALSLAILNHKEITTTLAKAKEAKRHIEKLITYTKNDTVHARRMAYKVLNNHQAVKVLFDEVGPAYEDRSGGYSRVIQIGQRRGDAAEMAILQLVGFEKMDEIAPVPHKAESTKKVDTPEQDSGNEKGDNEVKTKAETKPKTVKKAEKVEPTEEVKAEAETVVEEKTEDKDEGATEPLKKKEENSKE